jgi:hypothetical protein
MAERADYRAIVELEEQVDAAFRGRAPRQPLDAELMALAGRWSQAVWAASETRPSPPPAAAELDRGLALAHRPVFVCGVQRSGTTLLRDLLDGHPQLAVIPTESAFYTALEPITFGLRSDRHAVHLGRQWLERLIYPPPHWLLGRSRADSSPYVDFARDFAGWWRVSEQSRETRTASWPLCAFALAYAQHRGFLSTAQMWVEKSPTSERFLPRIWYDFPAAKVIHIVRRPEVALASFAVLNREAWSPRMAAAHCLLNMAPSYRIARQSAPALPADRYLLVRYEDLLADRQEVMARIAHFLNIAPSPEPLEPTIAGRPAIANSSYDDNGPRPALRPFERVLLALALGRNAAALGYGGAPGPLTNGT